MRACGLTLALALLVAPASAETLIIGTTGDYAPFLVPQPGGGITGIEGDLVTAICARADWTCEWQILSIGEIFDALRRGDIDLGAAGMGYISDRDTDVLMACPYLPPALSGGQGTLYVLDPNHDPRSGPIAAVRDTVFVDRLLQDDLDVRLYPDFDAAIAASAAGEVPAYFGGSNGTETRPGGAILIPVEDLDISGRGLSIAITTTRPDLLHTVNGHLAAVSADGTITDIFARWSDRHVPDPIAECTAIAIG
jgi:ABC-type amino acid transport substrate-binding protein